MGGKDIPPTERRFSVYKGWRVVELRDKEQAAKGKICDVLLSTNHPLDEARYPLHSPWYCCRSQSAQVSPMCQGHVIQKHFNQRGVVPISMDFAPSRESV